MAARMTETPVTGVRLPPELRTRVEAAAKADGISMSDVIIAALEERFEVLIVPRHKRHAVTVMRERAERHGANVVEIRRGKRV